MAEKSGIEMLEEILFRLSDIEKRLDVLDRNIKVIANSAKLSELVDRATKEGAEGWAKAVSPNVASVSRQERGFKNFGFAPSDGSKDPNRVMPRANRRTDPINIPTKGKIKFEVNGKTIPLQGISVKIYNEKDELVKETKTNRAGHWMSALKPGRYVALFEGEVAGKKLLPQNKNFEVPTSLLPGQTEFEVL